MLSPQMLSESEKQDIVEAVRRVEKQTNGEVVVSVVGQSDQYNVASWRAGVFFSLCFVSIVLVARPSASDWVPAFLGSDLMVVIISILVGVLGGYATKRVPMLLRAFVLDREFEREVTKAAAESFIAEEVFSTRSRTGILLFVSELERLFEVVADSGIEEKVADNEWITIVDQMVHERRESGLAPAIISGVNHCGDLLRQHFPSDPASGNELPDEVRTEGDES